MIGRRAVHPVRPLNMAPRPNPRKVAGPLSHGRPAYTEGMCLHHRQRVVSYVTDFNRVRADWATERMRAGWPN